MIDRNKIILLLVIIVAISGSLIVIFTIGFNNNSNSIENNSSVDNSNNVESEDVNAYSTVVEVGGLNFNLPKNYELVIDEGYDEEYGIYKSSFYNPSVSSSLVIIEVSTSHSLAKSREIIESTGDKAFDTNIGNYQGYYYTDFQGYTSYVFEKSGNLIILTIEPGTNIDINKIVD